MKYKYNIFKQLWIDSMFNSMTVMYPNLNEKKIKYFLEDVYNESLKNQDVCLENNYTKEMNYFQLTEFIDWYFKEKPITTEYGVLFKQHDKKHSLVNEVIDFILSTRSEYKNKMKENIGKDQDKVLFYDLRQKVMKIFANSIYGALGNKAFIFYNVFNAEAITKKGQNMITNCYYAFEEFLQDNIKFLNLDDIIKFIGNTLSEDYKYNIYDYTDRQITKLELKKKLLNKCEHKTDSIKDNLNKIINTLTDEEIQKLYYKNNFIEFSKNQKIKKLWKIILVNDIQFRDPNKVPEDISKYLNKLWDYLECFVFYKHMIPKTRERFKLYKRKVVTLVDTDSNMINLKPYYDFFLNIFNLNKEDDEVTYRIINSISYIVITMINSYLDYFCECTNIKNRKFFRLKMKNEFLLLKLILTQGKKHYVALLGLQEGKIIPYDQQILLKGISIRKNTVNKNTSKTLSNILENRILRQNKFSNKDVLNDLTRLSNSIIDSFNNGETTYMTPASSKSPEKYDVPYRQAVLRGILVWNKLYPNKEITFPAQVNTVKLKAEKITELEIIKEDYPKEYKIIKEYIFENPELVRYGFAIFAIPKDLKKIPDFIKPLIDIDTIVTDNLKNFLPLSKAIGIKEIYSTKDTVFISNIVSF